MKKLCSFVLVSAGIAALTGCPDKKPEPTKAEAGAAPEPHLGVYTKPPPPTDVPEKNICLADSDCEIVVTVPGEDPCCNDAVENVPMAVKYMRFMHAWQTKSCKGAQCPGVLISREPKNACLKTAKCVDNVCANACPPDAGAPPSDAGPKDAGSKDAAKK